MLHTMHLSLVNTESSFTGRFSDIIVEKSITTSVTFAPVSGELNVQLTFQVFCNN